MSIEKKLEVLKKVSIEKRKGTLTTQQVIDLDGQELYAVSGGYSIKEDLKSIGFVWLS